MIDFLEEGHIYLVNGVLTPSVSDILSYIFPDKYKGVDEKILNNKARYGTKIHNSIELYETILKNNDLDINDVLQYVVTDEVLDYIQEASLRQYIKLKNENSITVLEQEKMIQYQGKYAGRFDMIADISGDICLCDIKTTAVLDEEYLSYQLSYYELALGKTFDKLFAIWLPKKGLGVLKEIKRKSQEELLKKLNEFLEVYKGE